MKHPKYQVFLNDSEYSALLCSLIELKNSLIEQGRYTDVIDEILIKLSKSKRKKKTTIRYVYVLSTSFWSGLIFCD